MPLSEYEDFKWNFCQIILCPPKSKASQYVYLFLLYSLFLLTILIKTSFRISFLIAIVSIHFLLFDFYNIKSTLMYYHQNSRWLTVRIPNCHKTAQVRFPTCTPGQWLRRSEARSRSLCLNFMGRCNWSHLRWTIKPTREN